MILTALHKLATQDKRFTKRESTYLSGYEDALKTHFRMIQGTAYASEAEKNRNDQAAVKRAFRDKNMEAFDAALSQIFASRSDLSTIPHELYQFFPGLFKEGAEKFLDKYIERVEQHPKAEKLKRKFLFHKSFTGDIYDFSKKLIKTGNTAGLQRFIDIAKTLSNGDFEVRTLLTTGLDRYNRKPGVKEYGCLEKAMRSQQPEMVNFLIETAKTYSTPDENIAQDMLLHHADDLIYSSLHYNGDKPETLAAVITHEYLLPKHKQPSIALLADLKGELIRLAADGKVNSIVWLRDLINQHAENPEGTLKTLLDENIEYLLEGLDGSHIRDWEYEGLLEHKDQQAVINAFLTLSEGFEDIRAKILENVPLDHLAQAYFIEQATPLAIAQDNNPRAKNIWKDKLGDFDDLYSITSKMLFDNNAEAIDKLFQLAQEQNKLDELVEYCINKEGPKVLYPIVFALKLHEYGYNEHARSLASRNDFGSFHQAISTRYSDADGNYSKKVEFFLHAAEQIGGRAYAKEMLFSRDGNALRGTKLAIHEIHSWHDYGRERQNRRHKSIRTALNTLINKANELDGVDGVRQLLLGSKRYYLKWDTSVHTEDLERLRKKLDGREDDPSLLEPDFQFLKELQKWHTNVAMDLLTPYFSALTYKEFRSVFTKDGPVDHSAYKDLAGSGRIRELRHFFTLLSKDKRDALLEDTSEYFDVLLRALLENHDRTFSNKKEERLLYKRLYIDHGKGNERWEYLTGGKAPHPSLMDFSPVGFYGAKVKLYNHLLPFMKTATTLERNDGAEANAFKFSVLFRNAYQVEQYLDLYEKRWNYSGSKQVIHDAALIDLPVQGTWTPNKWGDFVAQFGPNGSKFLPEAPRLEVYMKKHGIDFPSSPKKMSEISAKLSYKNADKNIEFAKVAKEHGLGENSFDLALNVLERAGTFNHLPDVFIDGADIGYPNYYMKRLKPGDPIGLLLGKLTNCCQYVGGAGDRCAQHGTTSEFGGFYVWQKKTKGCITPKDNYVAQSWAWIGKDNALVLDSFERLSAGYNDLTQPFLEQLAFEATGKHKFTTKTGENGNKVSKIHTISSVRLGGSGNTPNNIFEQKTKALSEPIDTRAYDAKSIQYDIEPIDHAAEPLHGIEPDEDDLFLAL